MLVDHLRALSIICSRPQIVQLCTISSLPLNLKLLHVHLIICSPSYYRLVDQLNE